MCIAVNTTWRNTGITDTDIRRVFYRQPCLVCVLAKRNKDSKLIWSRKPPPITDSKDVKQPDTTDPREDHQWSIGECISYDNVGPINPESIEGYKQFIAFQDTRSKYLFCYPVKTCNKNTFLYYLDRVLSFFTTRGFKPRILRSDYYTIFRSNKANQFYEDHQCRHESSAPYQQWQNAVERDIQTILLPASYSPTIMPLTFSLFLQLAVIQKLHMATMVSACLNAALPPDADWIVTTLEPHIAEVCGLDPAQEYRIANALYGLPDSGRLFYQHYKAALLAEGYRMSEFDT